MHSLRYFLYEFFLFSHYIDRDMFMSIFSYKNWIYVRKIIKKMNILQFFSRIYKKLYSCNCGTEQQFVDLIR